MLYWKPSYRLSIILHIDKHMTPDAGNHYLMRFFANRVKAHKPYALTQRRGWTGDHFILTLYN